MVYPGFFALGGNEIISTPRAAAYAAALGITAVGCGPCPTLARAVGDLPYSSPDADDAPWFDPIVPHSKEFAGLVGLSVTGLSKSYGHRDPVPLTTGGASLHPLRRAHREIQIHALALAKSECALAYGFSWLASALRGSCSSSGCVGDTLCFFTCCPPCDAPPDPPDPDPCLAFADRYWREVLNVGLLHMEDPTEIRRIPGGWIGQVTFTLAAGNPGIFSQPQLMADQADSNRIIPNYDPNVSVNCSESVDCLRDPVNCPVPTVPLLPPVPTDICFKRTKFTAAQAIIGLEPNLTPIWAEKVPYIEIRAGARRMERITIRWYANPTETDCTAPGGLDPCRACAEVNLSFIPAQSVLVIDGRTETASVDCSGGPGLLTAEPQLYGKGGSPFVWPTFTCSDSMCLEVIGQADTVAADATIKIFFVAREDAT